MMSIIYWHILNYVRLFFDYMSKFIFHLKYWRKSKIHIPPVVDPILLDSSTSLANKIRQKKLSSETIVKAFIGRIKEVNPILNAVVQTRFEEALLEAKAVDDFLSSNNINREEISRTKPFLGVPFTIKDSFGVRGLKLTSGLYSRRDAIAEENSEVVQLLKEAGAIILGQTNVPELCMWWETSNTVYGQTNNPYDVTRSVGGSSGGEGCILSACGSPMGVGSDIGGSIRMPCFFNGIFGHKPSSGIVTNIGKFPPTIGERNNYMVTGPMCRFVCDISPMLRVMAGPNVSFLSLDQKVSIQNLRFYFFEEGRLGPLVGPVEDELILAQRKVLKHFEDNYKIKPVKIDLPHVDQTLNMFFAKLGSVKGVPSFLSDPSGKQGNINVWFELVKWLFGMSVHTFPALAYAIVEKLSLGVSTEALKNCEILKRHLKSLLLTDGVLMFPSHPTTAPYHSQSIFRPFNYAYTSLFNLLELPVTQCPLGLSTSGHPLGIQVVADSYQDHICLAVAEEIEKAFGGWVNPSNYKQVH